MPVMIQWVNVPPGASGSRTTMATAAALMGTPDQASGGDTLSPTHVYLSGIRVLVAKAGLVRLRVLVTGGLLFTLQPVSSVPTMAMATMPRMTELEARW